MDMFKPGPGRFMQECSHGQIRNQGIVGFRFRVYLLAMLLLMGASGSLEAGFDFPKGVPDDQLQFDGERIGRTGTNPASTIEKLMTKLGLTEDQAKERLAAIRKNILSAIAKIKTQDAELGRCLEDALNCERMCIDFVSQNANASVLPDGTTSCAKDPINIGINRVGGMELPMHDPGLFETFTSLMHESKHATQSYAPDGPVDPDATKATVQRRKKISCNEIEAEELENSVIDALRPALEAIVKGETPSAPAGAAGEFVRAVLAIADPAARKAAAEALLKRITNVKAFNDEHIACQEALKKAFDTFLASAGSDDDKKALNDAIRNTAWFATHGFRGGFDVVSDLVYYGGGESGRFFQSDGERTEEIDTGLFRLTDLEVLPGGRRAVLAGYSRNWIGRLLGYEDTDGDGFFEPTTGRILVISSRLKAGLNLTIDPTNGDVLVFSSGMNTIYRVADLDGDGFPETLSGAATVSHPDLESTVSIRISDDGRALYASPFHDIEDTTLLHSTSILVFQDADGDRFFEDADGDHFFEEAAPVNVFERAVFTPNFVAPPVAGAQSAEIYAAFLSQIEVHRVDADGNFLANLGSGTVDARGEGTLTLNAPLTSGDLLEVSDLTNGVSSLPNEVLAAPRASPCIPGGTTLCLNGNRFRVELAWRDPEGSTRFGQAIPMSRDAGYFWFFSASNAEILIKILDGRALNGHFWVYFAALSDLELEFRVTDTETGILKTYTKPAGRLTSGGDTVAFPDAPALSPFPAGTGRPHPQLLPDSQRAGAAGSPPESCQASPQGLCLQGRFRVEVSWQNGHGKAAAGAAALTPAAGYLWFWDESSPEVAVKILDGRAVNGRFWVFWGGLSDLPYTIVVTDTETGDQKTYANPAGQLTGGGDTAAF
jgi:hypothetical protein